MVFEKVKELLCEQLELDESVITMDADLAEDFDADSLDIVDLIMSIEEEYGLELPPEAVENFRTVGDVVKYIEERI